MDAETGTLIVGASAAGLATAAELRRHRESCEIVEAVDTIAGSWRHQYDRLHLHTPRSTSALPSLPMPKRWGRYPSAGQVAEYLDRYQRHLELRPHLGQRVHRIERVDGAWETTAATRSWRSTNVVIATGRARVPLRPNWPGMDRYAEGAVTTSSRGLDQAAVDDVVRAGDVRGTARREQHDQRRDLFGRGEAAGGETSDARDHASRAASASTPIVAPTVSATPCSPNQRSVPPDRARRSSRGCPWAELLRQRLREVEDRRLGRAVVDRAAVGLEERVHGADVDDGSFALVHHRASTRRDSLAAR